MKKVYLFLILVVVTLQQPVLSNVPDSVYLFSYSTEKNGGRNGLHFAWSTDQENWKSIGPEMRFLFCDYGRWGTQKRMVTPFLFQTHEGMWHCVWSVNEKDGAFAHAESKDLVYWTPQSYPIVMENNNCLEPEISYHSNTAQYNVSWLSTTDGKTQAYQTTTTDLKNFSPAKALPLSDRLNQRKKVLISGNTETGTVHKVAWSFVENLIKTQQLAACKTQLYSENAQTDPVRFASLKPVDATITIGGNRFVCS